MFVLRGRPYSAHVLISFWCDSDNRNYGVFYVTESDISVLFILAIIKICEFSYTPLLELFLNICSVHIGPKEFARYIFLAFFSFFNKIQDGRQNPMSLSRA